MKLLEVIVCGNNHFMNNFTASLMADRQSRVTRSWGYLPDVIWELDMVCPDIVIFEIVSDSEFPDATFFSGYPAIKFIGINARDSVLVVFFDNGQTVVNADNLEWAVKKWLTVE